MDPLDLPRPIRAAVQYAAQLGVPISTWKAYRLAREGHLAVSRVGQATTTVRAILEALSPPSVSR